VARRPAHAPLSLGAPASMDGTIAIEEHFVTPELEDLVLNPVLRENFYVTISGNYHTPSLVGVLSEIGVDRVMFAVDHPFEDVADGADWFDALDLDPGVREQIASRNAARLLQLAAV
jgi:amidohydrolase family protein